ncbi:Acetyltransferase (GNAT) domain-containing protein [Arachidicoccus rhizosphaerae]|uniref:Acetyltransferase (GNAT) domain-containing protein n=1 Tax=Arachidicoccus rhizosphaerae TaxID=551991 RepID=A0A1H3ZUR6_9BACT|nr:GNAT family N-acetyltransferase [Arachidicoccus rhizosphaerae]SEA27516.1 Acetyltransferase (GNAT) domain-containing protein [Arachidicoccus rhizosphaerae]
MESKPRIQINNFNPSAENIRKAKGILGTFNETEVLTYKPFTLNEHGRILHTWCNKPYSAKFWNMTGSYQQLEQYFQERQTCTAVNHTIFFINDQPLAFAETYPIIGSELQQHIAEISEKDYGIHFLMAPPRSILENYEISSLPLTYFTFNQALRNLYKEASFENIYAEPDIENNHAITLAKLAGFKKLKSVQLPDKTAALMHMDKDNFLV